jgi:hypothetical protein
MSGFSFNGPPPPNRSGVGRESGKYAALYSALAERPGEWAMVEVPEWSNERAPRALQAYFHTRGLEAAARGRSVYVRQPL